jgi:hypothetical protein
MLEEFRAKMNAIEVDGFCFGDGDRLRVRYPREAWKQAGDNIAKAQW